MAETKLKQTPAAAVALAIARRRADTDQTLVHLASSDRRAEEIGRVLGGFVPDAEILDLPAWDCLPYDRASRLPRSRNGRYSRSRRAVPRTARRWRGSPP